MKTIKELAEFMHINYELISMELGWGTQEKCRVKFDDLPKENKQVMLKVAELVLKDCKEDVLGLIDELDFRDCGRFVCNAFVKEKIKARIQG